jgi:hypothetical protein
MPKTSDYFGVGLRFLGFQPVSRVREIGSWVGGLRFEAGKSYDASVTQNKASHAGTKIYFPVEFGYQFAPRLLQGVGARVMAGADLIAVWYTQPGAFYEKVNVTGAVFVRRPHGNNVEAGVELGYRHDNGSVTGGSTGTRAWLRGDEVAVHALIGFRR